MNSIETIRKNPQMYITGNFDHQKVDQLLNQEAHRGGGKIHLSRIQDDLIFIAGTGWSNYRWDEIQPIEGEVNSMHNEVIVAALCKELCYGSIFVTESVKTSFEPWIITSQKEKSISLSLEGGEKIFIEEHELLVKCVQQLDLGQYSFVLVRI